MGRDRYAKDKGEEEMSIYVNIAAVVLGLLLISAVFKSVIQKKMNERQSLLWILIGVGMIILGVWPSLIKWLSEKTGIWYPPAILFAAAFAGLLLIVFYHTVTISILNSRIHELAMQVALLQNQLAEGEKKENVNILKQDGEVREGRK